LYHGISAKGPLANGSNAMIAWLLQSDHASDGVSATLRTAAKTRSNGVAV